MRRKVNEISGICFYFWWTILNHELTRAAFRIACVAYARARAQLETLSRIASWLIRVLRAKQNIRSHRQHSSLKANRLWRNQQMLKQVSFNNFRSSRNTNTWQAARWSGAWDSIRFFQLLKKHRMFSWATLSVKLPFLCRLFLSYAEMPLDRDCAQKGRQYFLKEMSVRNKK